MSRRAVALSNKVRRRMSGGAGRYPTLTVQGGVAQGLRISLRNASADYGLGTNELPVQEAIRAHVGPGAVFFDIGANVGFFTLVAARLAGPEGIVHAFEPVPANADCVVANAARNRFQNVTVWPVAVGAVEGSATLRLAEHPGGATLAPSAAASGRIEVPVVSIDGLVEAQKVRAPTFVKVDVEGTESDVLAGMIGTIERHRPTLLIEVDAETRDAAEAKQADLRASLERFGYRTRELPRAYEGMDWEVRHLLATTD